MYLDKKARPKTIAQYVGNETIKAQYKSIIKNPPSLILLCGMTGCGKTTFARILAKKLDYEQLEFNISDARGIEAARDILELIQNASMQKKGKAIILNEMQGANKYFMNALLERTEEPPKNVIFIICTTEPQILLPAIKTRCTVLEVKPLDDETAFSLVEKVAKKEKIKIEEKYIDAIVKAAEGIPRRLMVMLGAIRDLEEEKHILDTISAYSYIDEAASKEVILLCRALINRENFKTVMKTLNEVKEQPETIRRIICSYMANTIKGGNLNSNAVLILNEFVNLNLFLGKPAIINSIAVLYS